MSTVRLLGLRTFRRHPVRAVTSILAVTGGVAMVLSVLAVLSSADTALRAAAEVTEFGSDVRIQGLVSEGGISPGSLRRITDSDLIALAAPVVRGRGVADLGGTARSATVLGLDCDGWAILLGAGVPCPTRGVFAQSGPPSAADHVIMTTPNSTFTITDMIDLRSLDLASGGDLVILPLTAAQDAFQRGETADLVLVEGTAGVSSADLIAGLGEEMADLPLRLVPPGTPPPELRAAVNGVRPFLVILALIGMAAAVVVVASTSQIVAFEQEQSLARAQLLGATRRQATTAAVCHALVLGSTGGLLAAAITPSLASVISKPLSTQLTRAAGVGLDPGLSPWMVVVGVMVGGLLAVIATAGHVRHVQQRDPLDLLSSQVLADRSRRPSTQVMLGCVATGLGFLLLSASQAAGGLRGWQPLTAMVGLLCASTGLIFSGQGLTILGAALARRTKTLGGVAWQLTLATLAMDPRRAALMSTAVGLAIASGVALTGFTSSVEASITAGNQPDGWIVRPPAGQDAPQAGGFLATDLVADLSAAVPANLLDRRRQVTADDRDGPVLVFGTDQVDTAIPMIIGERPVVLEPGQSLVGRGMARNSGLEVGDALEMEAPNGPLLTTVVGIWADGRNAGRTVSLGTVDFTTAYGPRPVGSLLIQKSALDADRIGELTAGRADVLDVTEWVSQQADASAAGLAAFRAAQLLFFAMAGITIASSAALATLQREPELATLVAVGAVTTQVSGLVLLEGALAWLIGVAGGALAGFGMTWALVVVARVTTGYANPVLVFDTSTLLIAVPTTAVLCALALSGPARRAARTDIRGRRPAG